MEKSVFIPFDKPGHEARITIGVMAPVDTGNEKKDKENEVINAFIKREMRLSDYLDNGDFFGGFIVAGAIIDDVLGNYIKRKINKRLREALFDKAEISFSVKVNTLKSAGLMLAPYKTLLSKFSEIRNLCAHNDTYVFTEDKADLFLDEIKKYFPQLNRQDASNKILVLRNRGKWEFAVGDAIRELVTLAQEIPHLPNAKKPT